MNITFMPHPAFDNYSLCKFCSGRADINPIPMFDAPVCSECINDFVEDLDGNPSYARYRLAARKERKTFTEYGKKMEKYITYNTKE